MSQRRVRQQLTLTEHLAPLEMSEGCHPCRPCRSMVDICEVYRDLNMGGVGHHFHQLRE